MLLRILTLGLAFVLGADLSTDRIGPRPAPADCASCHPVIGKEWRLTAHANAFRDPHWQREVAGVTAPERCTGCHAPEPVPARLGRMPPPRAAEREDGVTCTSCHEHRGVVHGPFGTNTAGHAPDADPLYGEAASVHLCASCHDTRIGPVLPLARDFRGSSHARAGRGCVRCHMPHEERTTAVDPTTGAALGPRREGRSHAILGPSDVEFAASAFDAAVEPKDGRVLLSIRNLAGHKVPGLVGRSFDFEVEQRTGTRSLQKDVIRLSSDNLLQVDETREFRFVRHAGATSAILRIQHTLRGTSTPIHERNSPGESGMAAATMRVEQVHG